MKPQTSTEIVPNMTLSEAIAMYRNCMDDIRKAFALLNSADERLKLFGDLNYIKGRSRHEYQFDDYENPQDAIKILEKTVWCAIVGRMGIERFMSIKAREELGKQLDKGDMPELNEENVLGLLHGMHGRIAEFAEDAIREVWEWLRPPEDSWAAKEYKSNPRFELAKCVKIRGCVQSMWRTYYVREWSDKRLDALERVFRILDGKGAVQKGYQSDLVQAINKAPYVSGSVAETEYFSARLFLKGAAHITFKRQDLVAEFNRICGGMTLRGERAA